MDSSEFLSRWDACAPALREAVRRVAEAVRRAPTDGAAPRPISYGTGPRALLVGGVVRDLALGRDVVDADVEVFGVPLARLREILETLFPGRVHHVGRVYGVFKVGLENGLELDVSIPRTDTKTGRGHKGFLVEGDPNMTPTQAAQRRDFTVNAMMADPLSGELLDPTHGMDDLDRGVLRVVDHATFGDDPLRVYRALQFAGRFDLAPDAKTREMLREMVAHGELDDLPKERVTEEIRKLLTLAEKPSVGFELARDIGLIAKDYPELHALIDTPQEPEWHPEGDVWIHTMMVVDQAARIIRQPDRNLGDTDRLAVMLGSLCHDLGKPMVTKELNGKIRSLEHEASGEVPTKALLSRWAFGKDAEQAVLAIVKDHLKPGMLLREMEKGKLTETQYVNAVRRLLKRITPLRWPPFLAACEADFRGRTLPNVQEGNPYEAGDRFVDAVERERLDVIAPKTLIQGRDLAPLGIPPGPEMGRIIQVVETARDNGEIRTKKEGLMLAKNIKNY